MERGGGVEIFRLMMSTSSPPSSEGSIGCFQQLRKNDFSGAMISRLPLAASDPGGKCAEQSCIRRLDKSPGESALLDLRAYTAGGGRASQEQG